MQTVKKILLPALLLACYLTPCRSQAEDARNATVARLKQDLSYLASDELEGRNVGTEGIAKAADFIAERFASLGLETDLFDGTPFQNFTIPGPAAIGAAAQNRLQVNGVADSPEPVLGKNFTSLSLGSNGEFEAPVVFAGYGITAPDLGYDDYEGIDVTGKVVIVLRKEPQQNQADSVFDGTENSQFAYFSTKELNAAMHGAAAMILVNDVASAAQNDAVMEPTAGGRAATSQQVPTYFATRDLIEPLVAEGTGSTLEELERSIDADLKPRSQLLEGITINGQTLIEDSKIPVRNVIAILPGAGAMAEQYVVIGAHYDHVGMGGEGSLAPGTVAIHNGADDNASGTVTLMEIARRLAADKPANRRTLVFMAFTGEEKGLLGSRHYVRFPRFPLEKTVAMINMDMVGRLRDNKLTVFGTGTATKFDAMIERLNEVPEFLLEKQAAGFGPSDHASFYEEDIPVLHFFTGLHNQYHRPSDDIDTVNYEGMARIAEMITAAVEEVATDEAAPEHVAISSFADVGRSRPVRARRAVLGIQLDIDADVAGVGVASVQAGSPAAGAGMQAGDVIVRLGAADISSIGDLRAALQPKQAGDTVEVIVNRGDEQVNFAITLGEG